MDILNELFANQDLGYKAFQSSLMPTVDCEKIIGVRTPVLRVFAKKIKWNDEFMNSLPHKYYEENNLHAFMICEMTDFKTCIEELCKFLPHIDNWATCDGLKPKCFKNNREELLGYISSWIKSSHTYTVRFAILMLMTHFLDDDFDEKYLKIVSKVKSCEYYVNMMIAWFFAEALVRQYDSAIAYIENRKLSSWVHNKTIQKARESFRITKEQKKYLKSLR